MPLGSGRIIATVWALLFSLVSVEAQLFWDGNGDGIYWGDPINWRAIGGALPGVNTNVVIDNTYQTPVDRNVIYDNKVGANTIINSLRITNPTAVAGTNGLLITTNLTVNTDVNLVASNGLVRLALGTGATNTVITGTLTVTNSGSGVSLVTVSNATSLRAGTLSLAGQFANFGSVNITNAFVQRGGNYSQSGGLLRVGTGGIMVGTNSSFSLMSISNGAVVTNAGQFVVGSAGTARSNTVLVTGTGTAIAMTSAAPLVVGSNGSFNTMTVSNSASVTVGGIIQVGALAGASNNTLTVTDSGTLLGGGNEIRVGSSGMSNTMSILNGATVTNSSWVQVGQNAGGRYNTLVVSGEGSVLSNAANGILVGNGGLGNMAIITNGASVVTPMIALGWGAAAVSNTVIIGGTGTQVRTIGSGIAVGTNGAFNTMVIASGAVVTNLGRTVVGGSAGATGNFLLVTDSGTYFTNAGQIRVGDSASQNRMVISNGATVLNADIGYIGAVASANSNSVLVTGAGSLWNIGSNLNVGANASVNNSLTIASGGAVRVGGGLTLGASATVTNDAASTFYIAGFFDNQSTNNQANNNLSGRWVFNGGGRTQQVEVASNLRTGFNNTNFYFGTISVGDPITGSNAFVQLVDVRQNAAPAGAGILVASNLNIATAGSTLDLNSRTVLVFNLSNSGTIQQVNGGGTLGTINAVNTFTNQGRIFVANGSMLQFSNAFINAASGTIFLRDGSVLTNFISGSVLTNYGVVEGVGTLKMTVGNEGTITATGGVLRLSGGFTNTGGAAGGPVNAGLLNSMGSGSELVVNQGFTNLGTINLGAGTVTATRIVNQNLISGYGTVLASLDNFARVTNDSGGLMTFASSVNNYTNGSIIARASSSLSFSNVLNNAGGLVKVTDQSLATFNAVVTNLANSRIEASNQSRLTFNAGVTNRGIISVFGPSTAIFNGTLLLGATGVITASATNSVLVMRGNFLNYSTNNTVFDTRNGTIFAGGVGASATSRFEVASINRGTNFVGFNNNFAIGTLNMTNSVRLVDEFDNVNGVGYTLSNQVMYVDVLRLFTNATLRVDTLTVYVGQQFVDDNIGRTYTAGVIINSSNNPDTAHIFFGAGGQIVIIPEPSTFVLFGVGMLFLAGRRRGARPAVPTGGKRSRRLRSAGILSASHSGKPGHQFRAIVAAGLIATTASADVLNDWFGVFPRLDLANGQLDTQQTPDTNSYHFLSGSLNPTKNCPTSNYVVDDWWGAWSNTGLNNYTSWSYAGQGAGTRPSGEEPYDVEAIYFGNDNTNIYISIITSFDRPLGHMETRTNPDILVSTGDLALDLKGKGHNLPRASDGFRYDYGVNINTEVRPASGNVTTNYAVGVQAPNGFYLTRTNDWYVGTPDGAITGQGELTNMDPNWSSFGGTNRGTAIVSYRKLYFFTDGTSSWNPDPSKTEVKEGVYDTYAIDVTISTNMFSLAQPFTTGDQIGIAWVEGCRNDANGSVAVVRLTATFVPEPSTAALLGMALALVSGAARPRRRR